MESLQENATLVKKVCEIYEKLSKLETLKPCKEVDNLFTELVHTCIPHSSINISTLLDNIQEIRSKLIRLCGEAEGHLEAHFSTILGSFGKPLNHFLTTPITSSLVVSSTTSLINTIPPHHKPPSMLHLWDLAPYPSPQ
ncbi:hypothetical protein L1987_40637 [Smallanthus sonchifolius]|uniref:Uncharacterized protein n=1 Tax=Smallanthus sonchifolius TaxID=185202 RepID=A0ACB9GVJ6_9ASTR|nr:hypothetical protein L1987_40637 [Smallanthus sonchifolius]